MEQTLNHGMCRCCASEGMFKNFSATYQWMGADEVYADMLKECFDISLTTADDWNNGGICEVCITQLRNASNFRKQVLQTEDQFKKALQDKLYKDSIVKVEVNRDEDDLDSDNNVSDFSGTEFEVPVKEELEETKTKKRTAKATTSRAKKAKTEDGEPSSKRVLRKSEKTKGRAIKSDKDSATKKSDKNRTGEELEKHRTNIRKILLYSNASPIRCRGGIGYACCFCKDQYPDPADLKRHTETHGETSKVNFMKCKDMYGYLVKLDITGLVCKICDEKIDTLEQLMEHLKVEHDKILYTDIKNHILPFKFDTEILRCFICLNIFNRFKGLLEHMNVHYRNYICEVCDAGFVNKHILLCHRECHKIGTFACEQCSKVFDTLRKRKLHERTVHNESRLPHKCGYCDERFKENFNKDEHLAKVHGVRRPVIKCQACEKIFETHRAWLLHTKRDHLMLRQHKCSRCEMAFYSKRELDNHAVKHTGLREFRCEVCLKSYGRLKTLKEHIRRLHTEDRIKCMHCGLAFTQNCTLKSHMLAKHGGVL